MADASVRSVLVARRAQLVRERNSISEQIAACDALLAGLPPDASPVPEPPPVVVAMPEPVSALVVPAPPPVVAPVGGTGTGG